MLSDGREATAVLIGGLPASGKTTFLAALWHIAANSKTSQLIVDSFVHGDRDYIQHLEQEWLAGNQMPRTPVGQDTWVEVRVRDQHSQQLYTLLLPDFSGEEFVKYFAQREWPVAVDECVRQMSGVLLFVNPESIIEPRQIVDVQALAAAAGGDTQYVTAQVVPEQGTPWDVDKSPTASVLVSLLDAMNSRRIPGSSPLRVALIVSAWDTMRGVPLSPEQWVRKDLALLHQYLRSNEASLVTRVFGVSAQGGDVTNLAEKNRLLAMKQSQRVEVIEDGAVHSDLTAPIAWAVGAPSA